MLSGTRMTWAILIALLVPCASASSRQLAQSQSTQTTPGVARGPPSQVTGGGSGSGASSTPGLGNSSTPGLAPAGSGVASGVAPAALAAGGASNGSGEDLLGLR